MSIFPKRILFKLLKNQVQNICFNQPFSSLTGTIFFSKLNLPKNLYLNYKTCKMYSMQNDESTVDLSFSSPINNKIDAITLIKEIVKRHKENNLTFILPWNDNEAMNIITSPFKFLLEQGIN